MNEVTMIGVDLAKSVFQAHGATAVGEPVFRKKLSRGQFLKFLSEQQPCGCCHVNSPNLQVGKLFVDQAACAADFHASNASSRW